MGAISWFSTMGLIDRLTFFLHTNNLTAGTLRGHEKYNKHDKVGTLLRGSNRNSFQKRFVQACGHCGQAWPLPKQSTAQYQKMNREPLP